MNEYMKERTSVTNGLEKKPISATIKMLEVDSSVEFPIERMASVLSTKCNIATALRRKFECSTTEKEGFIIVKRTK